MFSSFSRSKSLTFFALCLVNLLRPPALFSEDEWLNHFIEYSNDGKILKDFPQFHEGVFEIPQGVEEIGRGAFFQCAYITEIIIPDSVVKIGANAFSYCISLESIRIPDSVEIIEYSAFTKCESLTNIEIPESVKEIQHYAFDGSGLVSLVIKGRDVIIGSYFANDCSELEYVDLRFASGIGENAFRACTSLKEVILPKGIAYFNLFSWSRPVLYLYSENGMERAILSYDSLAWVYSETGLSIRKEPSLEGERLGVLEDRTPLVILSEEKEILNIQGASGKWSRIRYGSGEGWVFGGFLKDKPYWRDGFRDLNSFDKPTTPATERKSSAGTISTEEILGEWYATYKNGSPVSPGGSGESSLKNFSPNTGPLGLVFSFQENNNFSYGIGGTDMGYSGSFSLREDRITCVIQNAYDDGMDVLSYQIEKIDNTHIQITDLLTDDWYLCALYDDSLVDHLCGNSLRALIEYIEDKEYLGSTFPSEESLLMLAVQYGNVEAVDWLIHSPYGDVDKKNIYGMTALHYAMRNAEHQNSVEIVNHLISAGVPLNALDSFCQTALDYSLYERPRSIENLASRIALANAGGRSSRESWAEHMTEQDFR